MIIDIFTHVVPEKFLTRMSSVAPNLADMGKRMRGVTELYDMDARFRTMDRFDDYRQLVTMSLPSIESYADARSGPELARLANDAMAELVAKHPERFAGFAAAVYLPDMEASLRELDRAIGQLGAKGVQTFTNIKGRPLDEPAFLPLFAAMHKYGLPIWIHPERSPAMTDYTSEPRSRYEIWCILGWPYETSVTMTRLVFAGNILHHPAYAGMQYRLVGDLRQADTIMRQSFLIGCHQGLTDAHVDYLTQTFAAYLRERGLMPTPAAVRGAAGSV